MLIRTFTQPEDISHISNYTMLSGSEGNGSSHFNTSLNSAAAASEGMAPNTIKAMVSGMAALKALRARQLAAEKLRSVHHCSLVTVHCPLFTLL